jgi:hypothetical protein
VGVKPCHALFHNGAFALQTIQSKTTTMNHSTQPSPESILQMGTGFWASKVLLAAVDFDLFTLLTENSPLTAAELKQKLNLHCSDRNVYDFLDTLTGFGFLNREGILETATYSNTPDTDLFLDVKKPTYVGGMLKMLNDRLYGFLGKPGRRAENRQATE